MMGCLGLALLAGCSKQLHQLPPSSTTTAQFYSNTNDFTQAVSGAYNQLRVYPDELLWMGEMRSDNVIAASDGNRDWQGINDFSPNITTTAFIVGAWDNLFNGIYNTNSVLDALTTKGTNIPDTSLRRRFGENVISYAPSIISIGAPVRTGTCRRSCHVVHGRRKSNAQLCTGCI